MQRARRGEINRNENMKTIVWVLYVVVANANGDPLGIAEMEPAYDSKRACTQKATAMRLFPENYGCRPRYPDEERDPQI